MAKSTNEQPTTPDIDFALDPPQMTLLADGALGEQQWSTDVFQLQQTLGSVYDTLRFGNTPTPMAIALYGSWGTGKTSAMRWLRGLLQHWNKNGKGRNRTTVQTVWFEPWKYHTREAVWQGIIAEVILACMHVDRLKDKDGAAKKLIAATGAFGRSLGSGFLEALKAVKIKAGIADIAVGQAIDSMIDQVGQAARPEKAYLNEFETTLRDYIHTWLGKTERIVVFIDDLDRCLPKVALEVLEALKLYLSMEKLIFVVGLDRQVVDQLVCKHYNTLGVETKKARDYLDKMFQAEVHITPSQRRMGDYFTQVIDQLDTATQTDGQPGYWTHMLGERPEDDHEDAAPSDPPNYRGILETVLRDLAGNNPRQVKRLINSALTLGAGAVHVPTSDAKHDPQLRFAQGVQVYLIWRILDKVYEMDGHWVRQQTGCDFFDAFSKAVREHPEVKPPALAAEEPERAEGDDYSEAQPDKSRKPNRDKVALDQLREADDVYARFCHTAAAAQPIQKLLQLVNSQNLRQLMCVPFSQDVAMLAAGLVEEPSKEAAALETMSDTLKNAIASTIGKPVGELAPADLERVVTLRLRNKELTATDLTHVTGLSSLQSLDLMNAGVTDQVAKELAHLTTLRTLDLWDNKITDQGVKHLAELTALQTLDLRRTNVTDQGVKHLAELTALQTLYLNDTNVTDQGVARLKEQFDARGQKIRIYR